MTTDVLAGTRATRRGSRLTEFFFLATVFSITFAKLHWNVAGDVSAADVLTLLFLLAFAAGALASGGRKAPRVAVTVLAFLALFLLVYLVGFFNLDTEAAPAPFVRGLTTFVLHFLFRAAGAVLLVRGSPPLYSPTLAVLGAGVSAHARYWGNGA